MKLKDKIKPNDLLVLIGLVEALKDKNKDDIITFKKDLSKVISTILKENSDCNPDIHTINVYPGFDTLQEDVGKNISYNYTILLLNKDNINDRAIVGYFAFYKLSRIFNNIHVANFE